MAASCTLGHVIPLGDSATIVRIRGGKREPFKGVIAQPVTSNSARKSFSTPVATQFKFKAITLKTKAGRGAREYVGKAGAGVFTVKDVGVFRRFGSGRDDVQLLYHYAREQKLPNKLG